MARTPGELPGGGRTDQSTPVRGSRAGRRPGGESVHSGAPLLGSYPSARIRFGLFTRGCLVGVAVFSHPCNDRVLTSVFPLSPLDSVELGRFVLLDSVPANGESWFLTRAFECLRRKGLSGVVSFSDPVPRTKADGMIVHRGHVGICYQATSATFLGRTEPRTIRLLPDGSLLNDRTIQKIRSGEQGW